MDKGYNLQDKDKWYRFKLPAHIHQEVKKYQARKTLEGQTITQPQAIIEMLETVCSKSAQSTI